MKVNVFLAILSLILGALIFYTFYVSTEQIVCSVVAASTCTASLFAWMGLSLPASARATTLFKVAAGSFFSLFLLLNICFVWILVSQPVFIIANGIAFVLELVVLYGVTRSKV